MDSQCAFQKRRWGQGVARAAVKGGLGHAELEVRRELEADPAPTEIGLGSKVVKIASLSLQSKLSVIDELLSR